MEWVAALSRFAGSRLGSYRLVRALLLPAVLAACGGSGSDGTTAGSNAPAPVPAPASPAAEVTVQEVTAQLSAPWSLAFLPGVCIMITALGFTLLGESLREAMDPRTRKR